MGSVNSGGEFLRSAATSFGRPLAALLAFALLLAPAHLRADDYGQAYNTVENLSSEIRMSEGAVAQTLMDAMNGNYGEIQKWDALSEKMNELTRTVDANLPEITRSMAVVFEQDPGASLPHVRLGSDFDGNLNMVRGKKEELLNLAKTENAKLQQINDRIAKINKAIGKAAMGLMGDTLEGFLPTEEGLAGEATVIVLSAYFGPPGIAVAGFAVGVSFTINSLVSTYYNTQAAVEQAKALADMKKILEAHKQQTEQNLATVMAGAREMEQVEQILDRHNKSLQACKAKIFAAMEGWGEQSKTAFAGAKKKLEEEAARVASQPKPDVQVSGGFHGMGAIPPITSAEYQGEINAMIAQMESYARAVEDGGDPDIFQAMIIDWANRYGGQYNKANQEYTSRYSAYNEASRSCFEPTRPFWEAEDRAWAALWACRNDCRGVWDAFWAAVQNVSVATQAAYNCLAPFGKAMEGPMREQARLSLIISHVQSANYPYRNRVELATRLRTKEFWDAFRTWEGQYSEALQNVNEVVSKIPYGLEQWKRRADNIDTEMSEYLRWGNSIVTVRDIFLATAEILRAQDRDIKDAIKKYEQADTERTRVGNLAQAELTTLLNKYGKLIGYYWASNFYMPWSTPAEFTPHAPEQERGIAYVSDYVRNTFTGSEPEYVRVARKADLLTVAAIYENKGRELNFYTDWIDTYRYRLEEAVAKINRIALPVTKQGLYAHRDNDTLQKEFAQSPWSSLSREVDPYLAADDYAKLPWARYQGLEGLGLYPKIYAAQYILIEKLNQKALSYVQSRSSGGFTPVSDGIIQPLIEAWKGLRAVCERYESAAKPERELIGNAPDEVAEAARSVSEAFSKMPAYSREVVDGEERRFRNALNGLINYLTSKRDWLKPAMDSQANSMPAQLDSLLRDYPALYAAWKKQKEEEERRAEEQRKAWEAEQARIKAEEEARRAAEEEARRKAVEDLQTQTAKVRDLYDQFRQAYESRDDAHLMSLMGDSWEAGDGTSLSDLQMNFRSSFRLFDEIRYVLQNLQVRKVAEGKYSVSYDVTITSRIYKRNLKHEEKSSVNEEVTIDASGRAKISRTVHGRFWYVQ